MRRSITRRRGLRRRNGKTGRAIGPPNRKKAVIAGHTEKLRPGGAAAGNSRGCVMAGLRKAARLLSFVAIPLLIFPALRAEECCDPKGPFAPGEEYPDEPATCATIAQWADRAPETTDRISLAIRDRLAAVESNPVLAYLVMCEPPGMQVLCVTYRAGDLKPGDVVLLAGGYSRRGEKQIMLDPCLAARE